MKNGWTPKRPPVLHRLPLELEREAGQYGDYLILGIAAVEHLREAHVVARLQAELFLPNLEAESSANGAADVHRLGIRAAEVLTGRRVAALRQLTLHAKTCLLYTS